jgi:hypothetical protein
MSSSWSIQAPTLVGSNYDFWSEKVKSILQGQGCWDYVSSNSKIPATMKYNSKNPNGIKSLFK